MERVGEDSGKGGGESREGGWGQWGGWDGRGWLT